MAKKKKNRYGNPQKNIQVQQAAEAAKAAKEVEKAIVQQNKTDNKPLLMRIVVIAVAAVMVLGVVIGAVFSF